MYIIFNYINLKFENTIEIYGTILKPWTIGKHNVTKPDMVNQLQENLIALIMWFSKSYWS